MNATDCIFPDSSSPVSTMEGNGKSKSHCALDSKLIIFHSSPHNFWRHLRRWTATLGHRESLQSSCNRST